MSENESKNNYDQDDLQHLSDLEHVRQRPSMYIGDTGSRGLHHLVYEVVDNSIDEAMAGFASFVSVKINSDGSITVEDDGRGIPVDRHEDLSSKHDREISTLEGVMTFLKFGGKFSDKTAYVMSGGLHGVGVTVVNFLSQWCAVEVYRDGGIYQQEYEFGVTKGPVKKIGSTKKIGTKTTFKPDGEIFETTKYQYDILQKRLQELAFLNKGVKIVVEDERNGDKDEYLYENGIVQFVEHLNRASETLHGEVLHFVGEQDGVPYEIAMQYSKEYTENIHSYVNNINTHEGGTHVTGFRIALTNTINAYGKREKKFKDIVPEGVDLREGLSAVISIRVPDPKFEGQTKTKLGNSEVQGIVSSGLSEALGKFLEENPRTAKVIVEKAVFAAEVREKMKQQRKMLRERKSALGGGGLPGKLRDCISTNMEECELYLVEGDSAGGSAEGGRFKETQAILPLRGKIINAYKSRADKVLANEEVQSMIRAIDSGIGEEQDISKRRYGKVIIMTDADVDGSHIRTLLLCFFYRQMYDLVKEGCVYVAQPPLFRVRAGRKEVRYVHDDDEMRRQLMEKGLKDAVFDTRDGRTVEGEDMTRLCRILSIIEKELVDLERRGISLKAHADRADENGMLPVYYARAGFEEEWLYSRDQLQEFRSKHEPEVNEAEEDAAASDQDPANNNGDNSSEANGEEAVVEEAVVEEAVEVLELHEVRTINGQLQKLADFGLGIQVFIPHVETGSQESRYLLRRGENETPLQDLRGLLAAVRSAGEKGLQITRFKGLGEMNAEELRETTLDPKNRTMSQVTMRDAGAADEMFRILMGDRVEPRREFIEQHALEAELDV